MQNYHASRIDYSKRCRANPDASYKENKKTGIVDTEVHLKREVIREQVIYKAIRERSIILLWLFVLRRQS